MGREVIDPLEMGTGGEQKTVQRAEKSKGRGRRLGPRGPKHNNENSLGGLSSFTGPARVNNTGGGGLKL